MKTSRNILIAFILNLGFAIFEIFGGIMTNSVAILSDAIHDFGDALSIGLSYFLEKKSKKPPTSLYTYGYLRYSVLGALITTLILLVGSIFVVTRAIERLTHPEIIDYNGMFVFAVIGVFVNLVAAFVTREGDSLNQKAVNLHMLEDVLGWIIVLIGSVLIKITDFVYIDSVMSIGVALFIIWHSVENLMSVMNLFLAKVPKDIDVHELEHHICEIPNVVGVHHFHIWSMDGINHCATLHVVVNGYSDNIKKYVREELLEHGIIHSTIEIELETEDCGEKNCNLNGQIEHGHSHHHHHGHHHGHHH